MATYSILTQPLTSIAEGQVLQTTFQTTGVANGTSFWWSLSGTNITATDFSVGALLGTGKVVTDASGKGTLSISHTLRNDLTTEGTEGLQIKFFTNAARTIQAGTTANINILDTSVAPPPTYTITPGFLNRNEGLAITNTVKTTNVAAGTLLYWDVSGTGITADDFVGGVINGFGTVGANGQFTFIQTLANDKTTEGLETAQLKLYTDAQRTVQVGSAASYAINDTSLTPTYSVTPAFANRNEGLSIVTTVATTNLPAGSIVYWGLSGDVITETDFSVGTIIGQGTVAANGQFTFSHTLANDKTTEGPEKVVITLYSDATRNTAVATGSYIINDTSTGIATYKITPSAVVLSEGADLTCAVTTTNVIPGTKLYYQFSGTGVTAGDLVPALLTGSGTVGLNGQFNFTQTIARDFTTEGLETLAIKLFTDAALTRQVGAAASVRINDTSTTPLAWPSSASIMIMASARALNEGQVLTTTLHTSGVAAGTPLFWALSGTGITVTDFSNGPITGTSVTAANGMASFSHTIANDQISEGAETLLIKVFSDPARTKQVGTTTTAVIADTSKAIGQGALPPSYSIATASTAVHEGAQLTTLVTTTGVVAGTQVYWTFSGTDITDQDFSSGTMVGSATIGIDGKFQLSHIVALDHKTEGNETLKIKLFGDPALEKLLASTTVSLVDTSIAAGPESYTLTSSTLAASEGDRLSFEVNSSNVPDDTILFYQIRGRNVDATDLGVGSLFGQVLIKAGQGSFALTLSKDFKTEGNEELLVNLFSDKPGGKSLLPSPLLVQVADVSQALNVATEIFQPQFTPFAVKKWASPLPIAPLKQPEYQGTQPDPWGTGFAPQPTPGGQPGLYTNLDPNQSDYHGIAPEFYDQNVAGTDIPYYNTGDETSWYTQREKATYQTVVDGANAIYSTEIYGYDGTMPGSTFKTKVGAPVVVRHWNDLPAYPGLPAGMVERESIHLHGAHTPAHSDGYASFVINPGNYRDYYYPNTIPMGNDGKPDFAEAPSTMWYHDHGEDLTDLQVIKGMAGFWLAFDPHELELVKNHTLPGWWKSTAEWDEKEFMANNSPYDVPLALSDRRFNADGSFFYDGAPIGNNTDGYLGDVMLVNGKSYPYMPVEQTQYRLRMLGASTARHWHLSIQDENGVIQPHLRIGNDTWLLPNPIKMNEFTISPAQRADTVMDFSGYAPGTVLYLVNTAEQNKGTGPQGDLLTIGTTGFSERIMKFVVGEKTASTPTNTLDTNTFLRENTPILESEISNHRTFQFGRSNGYWLINQTHFEHDISNAPMDVGVAEEWTLINGGGGWWHPIHIHLESHQVQSINGIAPGPDYFPEKQFKSDTTLLGPNTQAVIFMKFRTFEGPFVFHCHILQHEDNMMMFNFDPNLDGPGYKLGDPIPEDRDYTPYTYFHPHTGTTSEGPTVPIQTPSPDAAPPDTLSPLILSNFGFSAWGTSSADLIQATDQDSYLNGRDGTDTLQGGLGNDMLVGGRGHDLISGGSGDDLLAGEVGHDILTGGEGRDGFYYVQADPFYNDEITDFEAGKDFISIDLAIHNANGANATWTWIGTNSFDGAVKGQVRFVNGLLQVDLDGNTYGDINVLLKGITTFDQNWLNVPTVGASSPGIKLGSPI
jgi:FtsP/CotA-like multicopper oxidase with cupredoxin domain